MTRAHAIVDRLLEMSDPDYVKDEVERLDPLRRVVISYSKYRHHEDGSGNYDEEHGFVDEDGVDMEPDKFDEEDGVDAVAKTVKFLKDRGATEPSSSEFHSGVWYTTGPMENYTDAWQTEEHCHLHGFSDEEEALVYAGVTKRR